MTRAVRMSLPLLWLLVGAVGARADQVLIATRAATGLSRPVFATTAPGDPRRMFVVEQHSGRIKILDLATQQIMPEPFLTVEDVSRSNEQGLLGLAFDPDYARNGYFYVNFTDRVGTTQIRRYQVSDDPNRSNPETATTVLQIAQPQRNHNGGWIGFHPFSATPYLFVATGDGGSGNDNGAGHTAGVGNAQDLTDNLLGKLLRIDVSRDDFPNDTTRNYAVPDSNPFVGREGDDEIWSYGLRNPWRNSFDRQTGDLYIADVGQNQREEINFRPAGSSGGGNFGWRLREGTIETPSVGGPAPADYVAPIHDYRHGGGPDEGLSITGGYVYRGSIPSLQGSYFYADYVSDQVWSLRHDGLQTTELTNWSQSLITDAGAIRRVASFAEDDAGELYVISHDGDIFRLADVGNLTTLVPFAATWSYLDDGSNPTDAWRQIEFDDRAWKIGPGQLGYGDGDESTDVNPGPSPEEKFVTTFFRKEFTVDDVPAFDSLALSLLYDDGAAVYLNGDEVARTDNLAVNADYDDLALDARENAIARFVIDPSHLVAGVNVLAVEVHQSSRNSSDMSFDLQLQAVSVPEPYAASLIWAVAVVAAACRQRRNDKASPRNRSLRGFGI